MALRWKVCGVTTRDDARAAVDAGADAIGLVFYPASPRNLSPQQAAVIAASLPRETWRVGVFVDRPVEDMTEIVQAAGLDFLQLSGDEPPQLTTRLPRHAFKTLRLRSGAHAEEAFALADRYPACTLLVDAGMPGEYGGTGRPANWTAAAALAQRHRLILAGGLRPDNVAAAIDAVGPWAIDVSSGVEAMPGRKDPRKLIAFSQALEPYR